MESHTKYPGEDPAGEPPALEGPTFLKRYQHLKPYVWQGKIAPAFWTVAGVFSLALNALLLIILILVGRQLFGLKQALEEQLIDGLYSNFVLMDQAVIAASVPVEDTIPVQFTLPVQTTTRVVLTEDTFVRNATVNLKTGGLSITDAPTDITLRAGTELPVHLDIEVPVDTTIPVHLEVAVEIPLRDTQLHAPFVGLQNVVYPYDTLFAAAPDSWSEALCAADAGRLCRWLRR